MNNIPAQQSADSAPAIPPESLNSHLVHNILRTHHYVSPCIDRSLRDLNLSGIQLSVLLLLQSAPEGLPLGEIGRQQVVTKANVTGLIDRLEQKGLVTRHTTDDRRVVLAKLTPEGARIVSDVLPKHNELLAQVGECLDDNEKHELIALLSKLRERMREKGLHHHEHHHHEHPPQPGSSQAGPS
jgi:MarR family 2-MHQ and catechol resistance regulon transcriptional repressor